MNKMISGLCTGCALLILGINAFPTYGAQMTGFPPAMGRLVEETKAASPGSSVCHKRLRKKGGAGLKGAGTSSEKMVQPGFAMIEANRNDPNYNDSRYVAFKEAALNAKIEMVKYLEQTIASEIQTRIGSNKNKKDIDLGTLAAKLKRQAANIKDPKKSLDSTANTKDTYKNVLKLINAKINKRLKAEGYDPDAAVNAQKTSNAAERKELLQKAKAAEKQAKKILKTKSFSEMISVAAKGQLKGVYTSFVTENVAKSGKGSLCVIATYSKASLELADAMLARDFSNLDIKKRIRTPITAQLPDPDTNAGLFSLITKWGLSVLFDEEGQLNLVAFAQSGVEADDTMAKATAGREAVMRADNLIRLFMATSFSVNQDASQLQKQQRMKTSSSVNLDKNFEESMMAKAVAKKINGISSVMTWIAPHPGNGRLIAGAVRAWRPAGAVSAIKSKVRQDEKIQDTGGERYKEQARRDRDASRQKPSQNKTQRSSGGLRGTTKSEDF